MVRQLREKQKMGRRQESGSGIREGRKQIAEMHADVSFGTISFAYNFMASRVPFRVDQRELQSHKILTML